MSLWPISFSCRCLNTFHFFFFCLCVKCLVKSKIVKMRLCRSNTTLFPVQCLLSVAYILCQSIFDYVLWLNGFKRLNVSLKWLTFFVFLWLGHSIQMVFYEHPNSFYQRYAPHSINKQFMCNDMNTIWLHQTVKLWFSLRKYSTIAFAVAEWM